MRKLNEAERRMNREEAIKHLETYSTTNGSGQTTQAQHEEAKRMAIKALEQEQKTGRCKDCKHFEYDSVAKVDGIPLIVAHEICSRWGDGCKTKEDGYCFLFEPQERSDEG